jgi:hypothetical protein
MGLIGRRDSETREAKDFVLLLAGFHRDSGLFILPQSAESYAARSGLVNKIKYQLYLAQKNIRRSSHPSKYNLSTWPLQVLASFLANSTALCCSQTKHPAGLMQIS